ncbi:hypothetical protein Tco_0567019 [Tanacetum coccineum]
MAPKKTLMSDAVIKALIAQGVADALADYKANRGNRHGHDSHGLGSGSGRTPNTTRVCTYKDFLNCQPLNYKGTEGVVGLTQWFKKMESVFYISNCTVECQIKSEIKKLEIEIWNLKVKGTDVVRYTQHFQELALMCGRMFPEESDQVEKYVGGLPDMIKCSVMASKPKTMQEAIEIANDPMDKKVHTFAERQSENKRNLDDNTRNNQTQQQPFKRQNVAKAYTAGPGEKKEYGGALPLCTKCNYHHTRRVLQSAQTAKELATWPVDMCADIAKNHKKTVKTGQKRTRERKSTQEAGRKISKSNPNMAQLLQAPIEGYEDAIVIPEINVNFELKHGLINSLFKNKADFGHDKEITCSQPLLSIKDSAMRSRQGYTKPDDKSNGDSSLSLVNSNTASSSNSGSLPSNTVTNPKEDLKGITTRSVEKQNPVSEPDVAPVSAPMPNQKSSIPFPSRQNDERYHENANEQKEKSTKSSKI